MVKIGVEQKQEQEQNSIIARPPRSSSLHEKASQDNKEKKGRPREGSVELGPGLGSRCAWPTRSYLCYNRGGEERWEWEERRERKEHRIALKIPIVYWKIVRIGRIKSTID